MLLWTLCTILVSGLLVAADQTTAHTTTSPPTTRPPHSQTTRRSILARPPGKGESLSRTQDEQTMPESEKRDRKTQEMLDAEMRKHISKLKSNSSVNGSDDDNVQFFNGDSLEMSCDFDSLHCLDDMHIGFSWTLTRGDSYSTNYYKPTKDANLKRPEGAFMFADMNCPYCDIAAGMKSMEIRQSRASTYCISFLFGNTGENVGILGLYVIYPESNQQQSVWKNDTDTGRGWHSVQQVFSTQAAEPFKIIFLLRQRHERGGRGAAYIDDLHLYRGQCQRGDPVGEWWPWTDFSPCSVSCGYGTSHRTRDCRHPPCYGINYDIQSCGEPCYAQWSEWNDWTSCSSSCGTGTKVRDRACPHGAGVCQGARQQSTPCFFRSCGPPIGNWYPWNEWSHCDGSCRTRYGTRIRNRACPVSYQCNGRSYEEASCYFNCAVSGWSEWTMCSKTCGNGVQFRARGCVGQCETEDRHQSKICNVKQCQQDPYGIWGEWSYWTVCTATCGGQRFRARTCTTSSCIGRKSETDYCSPQSCNNDFGEWSSWGRCTRSCGGGEQVRRRQCHGSCVGIRVDTRLCNNYECPQADVSPWSNWSICPVTCGRGTHYRTRRCQVRNCDGVTLYESQQCSTTPCVQSPQPAPIPGNQDCGRPGPSFIIGGREASNGAWPWHVGVFFRANSFTRVYQCGGAIIHKRYVITAAHCVYQRVSGNTNRLIPARNLYVMMGNVNLRYGTRYNVMVSNPHPSFSFAGVANDVAILKLDRDVKFTSKISPVCLPTRSPRAGQSCPVIGWGKTSIGPDASLSYHLKQVSLEILTDSSCRRSWYPDMRGMFCAGRYTRTQNSNGGDSGGSVNCMDNGRFTLQGVVSFGDKSFRAPSVFTDVHYYKRWIEGKMAALG